MKTCLDCDSTDLHGNYCCNIHYRRRFREGTLPKRPTREEAFWSRVEVTGFCWLWLGHVSPTGYGRTNGIDYSSNYPHRVAYEYLVGPIPEGLTIDHLCRIKLCVNPDHLEPVTDTENVRRRPPLGTRHRNARKTQCPKGHEYDVFYTKPDGGRGRRCSICSKEIERNRPKRDWSKKRFVA